MSSRPKALYIESPASADFSLELNGELEPNTPNVLANLDALEDTENGLIALDPDVLTSLVIQLRENLSSTQRERNNLRTTLTSAQSLVRELEGHKERADKLEEELAEAWRKNRESEEAIAMLRTKVEESRRAVMRLQSDAQRRNTLGTPHQAAPMLASPFALSFDSAGNKTPNLGTSTLNKRASLTAGSLLVGAAPKGRNFHRRQSSQSEPANSNESNEGGAQFITVNLPSDQALKSARRQTMFARPTENLLNPLAAELEAVRQQLDMTKQELVATKVQLVEANEAREANDACVKALKSFIAEQAIGDDKSDTSSLHGLRLPPLPTDADNDDDDEAYSPPQKTPTARPKPVNTNSTWRITSFWSSAPTAAEATPKPQATAEPRPSVETSSSSGSVLSNFVAGRWSRSSSVASRDSNPPAPPAKEDRYSPAPSLGGYKRKFSLFGANAGEQEQGSHPVMTLPPRSIDKSPSASLYTPSLTAPASSSSGSGSPEEPASPEREIHHHHKTDSVVLVASPEPESRPLSMQSLKSVVIDDSNLHTEFDPKASGEMTPTVRPAGFAV